MPAAVSHHRALLLTASAVLYPLIFAAFLVLGGTWGQDPEVVSSLQAAMADSPRPVPVVAATVQVSPDWEGARRYGLEELRTSIAIRSRTSAAQT